MAKNILITGANGQLGNELRRTLNGNSLFNTFYTDVKELDITCSEAINEYLRKNCIEIIVNCAAYTAVDLAEDNADACRTINTTAVENIAKAAKANGAKVIHISTDYVFDGKNNIPYTEKDQTNPQTVYGKTKAEGESSLISIIPNDCIIIRTAWLYSAYGKNFVKTMLELGRTRDRLNVVCDQIGTPTYAADLASAICSIISCQEWVPGIYHFSNEGACSWYDFTKAIHRIAGIQGCKVMPVATAEYPTKAQRPSYSVLDKSKFKTTFKLEIPHWQESLERCIEYINELNRNI